MKRVKIYTDGACSNNPGPGGWAVVFTGTEKVRKLSGFSPKTTNNRMELKAVVKALEDIYNNNGYSQDAEIEIYSDSAYVVNAINNAWVNSWEKNNWKTAKGSSVKNRKLWEAYLSLRSKLSEQNINVKITKVKGHAGNTYNEYVDGIARSEVNNARLYIATNNTLGGDI